MADVPMMLSAPLEEREIACPDGETTRKTTMKKPTDWSPDHGYEAMFSRAFNGLYEYLRWGESNEAFILAKTDHKIFQR